MNSNFSERPEGTSAFPLSEALDRLTNELRNDSEYYYGWQSNIAMAFKDEFDRATANHEPFDSHKIANQAAKNFLNLLIGTNAQR